MCRSNRLHPDPRGHLARHTRTRCLGPVHAERRARKERRGELPDALAMSVMDCADIWRVLVQSLAFNIASCDERLARGREHHRHGGARPAQSPVSLSEDPRPPWQGAPDARVAYDRRATAVAQRTSLRDGAVLSLETLGRMMRVNTTARREARAGLRFVVRNIKIRLVAWICRMAEHLEAVADHLVAVDPNALAPDPKAYPVMDLSDDAVAQSCAVDELVYHVSARTDESEIDVRHHLTDRSYDLHALRTLCRWASCRWLPTKPAQLALMLRGHCVFCSDPTHGGSGYGCRCKLCPSGVMYSWDLQSRGRECPTAAHTASIDLPWVGEYYLEEHPQDTSVVTIHKDAVELPWTSAAHILHIVVERMSVAEAATRLPVSQDSSEGSSPPRTTRGGIGGQLEPDDAHLHFLAVVFPTSKPPLATRQAADVLNELARTREGVRRIARSARDLIEMQIRNVRSDDVWSGISPVDRERFVESLSSYCVGDVRAPVRDCPLLAETLQNNPCSRSHAVDNRSASWKPHSLQGILRLDESEFGALEAAGKERRLSTKRMCLERWDRRRKRMLARCVLELRSDEVVGYLWRGASLNLFEEEGPPEGFEHCPNAMLFLRWSRGAVLLTPATTGRVRTLRSLYHAFTHAPETLLRPLRIFFRYAHALLSPLQMPVRKAPERALLGQHVLAGERNHHAVINVMLILQNMLAGESTNSHGLLLEPWQGDASARASAEPTEPDARRRHIAQRAARAPHVVVGAWLRALCSRDYVLKVDVLHVYERVRADWSDHPANLFAVKRSSDVYPNTDSLGATFVIEVRHRGDEGRQLEFRGMRFHFTLHFYDVPLAFGEPNIDFGHSYNVRNSRLTAVPQNTRRQWRTEMRQYCARTNARCDPVANPDTYVPRRIGLFNSLLSANWVKKVIPKAGSVSWDGNPHPCNTLGERVQGARVLRARIRTRAKASPVLPSFESLDKCHCRYLGFTCVCRCTGNCYMGNASSGGLGRDAGPSAQGSIVDYLESE